MPRSTQKPYSKVLEYFRTAPAQELEIVQDLVKQIVKDRFAVNQPRPQVAAPSLPAASAGSVKGKPGPKPGSKRKKAALKAAIAKVHKTAEVKERKKPGPKPGSHRKKSTIAPVVDQAADEVLGTDLPPQTPAGEIDLDLFEPSVPLAGQ